MKQLLARRQWAALTAAACSALALLLLYRAAHPPAPPATLGGKWVGTVTWNDASGRPYAQRFPTALFFLPKNVCGIVVTFPTGAVGGAGTYALRGHRLTVHGDSLSVNGRPLPVKTFSHEPWYRATAVYTVAYDDAHLTLTPDTGKTPAPCWPLLVSPAPIRLSRLAPPDAPSAQAAPRE